MKTSTITAVAISLLTLAFCTPSQAQVQAYHHRSTVAGDRYAGRAELVLATGIAQHRRAMAESVLADARRKNAQLQIDLRNYRIEERRRLHERRADRTTERLTTNLERREQLDRQAKKDADRMVEQLKNGTFDWPYDLQAAALAPHVQAAESIMIGESSRSQDHAKLAGIADVFRAVFCRRTQSTNAERAAAVRLIQVLGYVAQYGTTYSNKL